MHKLLGYLFCAFLALFVFAGVAQSTEYLTAYEAVKAGDSEAVKELGKTVDLTTLRNYYGETLLHVAVRKGDNRMITLCAQYGINPLERDKKGLTAVHLVKTPDAVKFFCERGVPFTLKDNDGNTPLIYAASAGIRDVVAELIRCGADASVQNNEGNTAIHYAAKKGYVDVIALLVDAGAEINVSNSDRLTPLYLATESNRIDVVEQLIQLGAAVDIPDKEGSTPLHVAAWYGYPDMAVHLIHSGANIEHPGQGYTPFELAQMRGNSELMTILLDAGYIP